MQRNTYFDNSMYVFNSSNVTSHQIDCYISHKNYYRNLIFLSLIVSDVFIKASSSFFKANYYMVIFA